MHTATLPDGRKIDVLRLQQLLADEPVEFLPLTLIKGASRSQRRGFSQKRYANADPNVAGIVNAQILLLDGRHRFFKRLDSGCQYMPVRQATTEQIESCIIKRF